ncbi:MAG TPA: PRC-barrel domain-containing protein [Bacillales bacterium]|nr:PRC-barrel domain-containing protein [Bacillales bacterium]
MILSGNDILGKIIVQRETNEEKSKVNDLLIEKNQPYIAYLTFELEKPADHPDTLEQDQRVAESLSAGGRSPAMRNFMPPGRSAPGTAATEKMKKVPFLIPRNQIERMTENAVIMEGTEAEAEKQGEENFSYSALKDCEVKTEDGEKLGKIKDIVIEEMEQKVIGLKLSEGFWETLTGDGTKYMPYDGGVEWQVDKILVKNSLKDRLVDQFEELL